jgi:hypothetical protein
MSFDEIVRESGREPLIPPISEGSTITDGASLANPPEFCQSASPARGKFQGLRAGLGLGGVARRTLGIFLLLVTVVLWTGSNFLASVSISKRAYHHSYLIQIVHLRR